MATKETLPNEAETLQEEVAQSAEVVEEVAVPVSEQPAPVEATPVEQPAPAQDASPASESFGTKFKKFFVKIGKTVKGWFVKEQAVAVDGDGNPVVLTDEDRRIQAMLDGPQLSKGEKFRRFCRSQSGWLFVLPAILLMCVFTFYPIITAFIGAFKQDYDAATGTYNGWGFSNFVTVWNGGSGGASFVQCLFNTFFITIISVPLSIIIALLIAVALNSIKVIQKAYQTILFLPYLTNALAMGAVFLTFFQVIGTKTQISEGTASFGLINNFLAIFGVKPIRWIQGITALDNQSLVWDWGSIQVPWTKYMVVIVYEVWAGLPFKILILFSALQSVNKQYYDAAKIDGASKTTTLVKITAPLIGPMLSYLFITGIMGGMKQYTAVVGIFGETMGTNYDMGTMVGYIYQFIKRTGSTGYAYAGSLLLFLIIMVITAINNYVSKKRVTF